MRAVCILWAFALFSAEMSEKLTFAQKISDDQILAESETGHGGHSGPDPYIDVNVFLLSLEAEEWTHGHDEIQMTKNRMEQTALILLYRFGCSLPSLCTECAENITNHVVDLVDDHDDVISEEEFEQASVVLFHMTSMESMESACRSEGSLSSVDGYTDAILSSNGTDGVLTEGELDLLLDDMIDKYTPTSQSQCFGVESLFDATVHDHEAGAEREEVPGLTSLAVSYMVQGYCIGSPTVLDPHEFTHDVFAVYGTDGIINEEEYGHMLTELSIGGVSDHVHAHGDTAARKKRAADHDHDHEHPGEGHIEDVTITCFSGEELWDIYGIDHETGMNEAQFEEMCPSLIQQMVRHVCEEHSDHVVDVSSEDWLYGTLAVVIVSLASVLGGLLIPWLSPDAYEKFVYSLISLAVAILVGDALIHLLPLATGLHAIDHNHASHSPTDPEMAYIWKSLACLLAVYFFYVFETLMGWFSGHDHSVTPAVEGISMAEAGETKTNGTLTKSISKSPLTENVDSTGLEIDTTAKHWAKRYGPIPYMIIIGDTLHNLGDGLAIGASFAEGMGPGLSTTLAVFCHEVPHELGDLGVLLKLGIKLKWALLLNLLSSLSAFVGLYIGLGLAQTEEARQWIFAITAGIFIYVALADMVPQITNIRETKNPWVMFCLQNVFFLCGIGFILVLALYEDDISVSL